MKTSNFAVRGRKADSKMLSIWWFAVLVVIAVGIVVGTTIFFGGKLDVRAVEAEILANKIADCLVENGKMNQEFLNENTGGFDISSACSINKTIIQESGNYYLEISIANSAGSIIQSIRYGNAAFEKECSIGAAVVEAKYFPRCASKKVSAADSSGRILILTVLAGSNYEYRLEEKR